MKRTNTNIFYLKSEKELAPRLGKILSKYPDIKLFALYGELGSGKTRLVKAFCELKGISDLVSSPSFSIINEYDLNGEPIYHVDLYRLKTIDEALAIGIEDYLLGSYYCFIEWPQLVESIIPDKHLKLHLEITGEFSRILQIL